MGKGKLAKAASIVMVLTLVSKVIGFLRDILIASTFGATYITDAYNVALTISDILFALFSLAIMTTFIPLLSETYKNKGKKEMFLFANNIMNILVIILTVLSLLGWAFTPQLVHLIAPRFTGEAYNLTVTLTAITIFNIIFMGITGGYNSILQVLEDFTSPALVGIMLNLPIILYILMGATGGVIGLTIATLAGNILKVVVQLPSLIKHGYRPRYALNIRDTRVHKMVYLLLPVIIGAGSNQINAIVDRMVASGLPEGSISSLNYASKITDVVYVTFATAIVTVIYPYLSREGTSESYVQFKQYIIKAVNSISLIMIPCCVGLIILSTPLVNILFKHGKFDDRAVYMTSLSLIYFCVGLPFYGIRDVFNRALYALNDTKTSTINGVIGVVINIILNLTIVRFIGLRGIALSTSIAAIVCAFLLANSLRRKIGGINGREILKSTFKIAAASLIMGIVVYGVYYLISAQIAGTRGILTGTVVSTMAGILIYLVSLILLKVEEVHEFMDQVKVKLRG